MLVDAYNPRYGHLLEGKPVQGRPLEDVMNIFWHDGDGRRIAQLAHEVYRRDEVRTLAPIMMPVSLDAADPDIISSDGHTKSEGNSFVYTLVPSHNMAGRVDGVIIYAVDEKR